MIRVQFDHFLTYTHAESIDAHLDKLGAQGFLPQKRTVRHDPGLRNGFLFLGPEYLEFLWVEDESLFAAGDHEEQLLRSACRPCAIGMSVADVHAAHDDWTARGYSLPAVFSKGPRDAPADAPPAWSFQEIPAELLPGAGSFLVKYCTRANDPVRSVHVGPNTIYAIAGATFVASQPEARATCWRDLLAPQEPVTGTPMGYQVEIGPHRAAWTTPGIYRASYGVQWTPAPHACGEIALLHLLAEDLGKVQTCMREAGRATTRISTPDGEALLIEADPLDGFTFAVRQRPVAQWLRERTSRTGETLELAPLERQS